MLLQYRIHSVPQLVLAFVLTLVGSGLPFSPVFAQDEFAEASPVRWTGRVILESSVGENHADGQLEFLAPVWSSDDTLMFLYPSIGVSSDVDPNFSFGMGIRQYIEKFNAIVGAGVFFIATTARTATYTTNSVSVARC